MIVCFYHRLRPAAENCEDCEIAICKYCVFRTGDYVYCPDCKNKHLKDVIKFQ